MKNENLIKERIKKGLCPICGKEIQKDNLLIDDPIVGLAYICNTHIVKGIDKLEA